MTAEGYVQPKKPELSEYYKIIGQCDFINYEKIKKAIEDIDHYKNEFNKGFAFYTPRLNYPPEEAQTIIRDQTRSTYLEEIVHPLRESLFINGFEPKSEKDTIIIENKVWQQKIIVRLVPSSLAMRLFVLAFTIVSALLLMREYEIWQKKN